MQNCHEDEKKTANLRKKEKEKVRYLVTESKNMLKLCDKNNKGMYFNY